MSGFSNSSWSSSKSNSRGMASTAPQPMTLAQIRSFPTGGRWVDYRDLSHGAICAAVMKKHCSGKWKVQLADSTRSKCQRELSVSETDMDHMGHIAIYPLNSMTRASPQFPLSTSELACLSPGDKVEVNKPSSCSVASAGTTAKWECGVVEQVCGPHIKVKLVRDGSIWCTHYLLHHEIRLSTVNTEDPRGARDARGARGARGAMDATDAKDAAAQVIEAIKNSGNGQKSDASLKQILDKCVEIFKFESKSDLIAHLMSCCKEEFAPQKWVELACVVNALPTRTCTDCTHTHSHVHHNAHHTQLLSNEKDGDDIVMVGQAQQRQQRQQRQQQQKRKDDLITDQSDEKHLFDATGASSNKNVSARSRKNARNEMKAKPRQSQMSGMMQQQEMVSKQEEAQKEQVVSVELLISSTKDVLDVVSDYADRMVELKHLERKSGNGWSTANKIKKLKEFSQNCNIKAVVGLQMFEMQFQGFRSKSNKRGISTDIGTKNGNKLINEFLQKTTDKLMNRYNLDDLEIGFVLDRITPFTNAMKSVLGGNKLPEFQELTNVNFDATTANNVLSNVMKATNHTIPERNEKVRKHYKEYGLQQDFNVMNMNENESRSSAFGQREANSLYRDIYHPMGRATSREEVDRRAKEQLRQDRIKAHQQPDLLQDDHDEYESESDF